MDHDHDSADLPGLKQAELREAAHEGPHGSHAGGHTGPVEEHDGREHAHEAGHGPAPSGGVDHAAMGHTPEEHAAMDQGAPDGGAMNHEGMDHSEMGHGGGGASGGHHDHHAMMVKDFKRRFWVCLGLTVPILALSPMLQMWAGVEWTFLGSVWVLTALAAVVWGYGGWPFLTGAKDELAKGRPGMMTLVALAITVAFVYSVAVVLGLEGNLFFWETATLVDLMLVGHWVEMRSVMGASRALEELARLMPDEAHRLTEAGDVEDVPTDQLRPGDRILVKASEKVPADGTVVDGRSAVNQAALTGESVPVEKGAGDELIAGSVNGSGALTVEVTKTGADAYLNQVVTLVREAQASKSKTQDLANRAAFYLTVTAITVGALTFAAWLLFTGEPLAFAIERAVTVMVIACPHALGLAIPLVVAVSTAISARNGLLIRDRTAFEAARNLQAVIFDKTGTLTEGRFGITDTLVFDQALTEAELLGFAAAVEALSEHPIAQGVATAVERPLPVEDFRAIPGKGVEGTVGGRFVQVVSPGYVRAQGIAIDDPRYETLSAQGKTVVFVLLDGQLAGAVALADVIRPEAKGAIADLKAMGIQTMMLTGDNRKVAAWVAEEIGLDDVFAEVLPEQKSDKVKEVQARGLAVAMTGDGVNDAPALAQADVGIAIGAGTDVAVETADIILVRSNPQDVATIVKLSRATYRKMIQNLWWAAGYNIVAIPLAAGVLYSAGILLGPAMGAVFMSASTVIVAVNARLLKIER